LAVTPTKRSLLIVDDEPYILRTLILYVNPHYEVLTADSADAAEAIFRQRPVDLLLTDQKMPKCSGIQFLEWVRQFSPRTVRLLMTGHADLEEAVESINRGHVYYYLLKPFRPEDLLLCLRNAAERFELESYRDQLLDDLHQLNRDLEQRVAQRTEELERAYRELQQQAVEMERLALTDPLTGLFNRRAVDGLALAELKRHARYKNSLALGIIDVDHFKQINTNYKLTGGDATLVGLAKLLTATMRETDSVGRVGGEEFLVIARETNEEGARILAERIRQRVEGTPIDYDGQKVAITVSIGFAVAEGATPAPYPQMYEEASAALNQAKREGRNRCVIRNMQG
jgi:diguanylate cyclase (GGDEF)-like protein